MLLPQQGLLDNYVLGYEYTKIVMLQTTKIKLQLHVKLPYDTEA